MIALQFVAAPGLASRAIAWWGNGWHGYSHVDAVLPSGELLGARSDRVGGKPAGVQIRPQGYERWLRREVLVLPASPSQAAEWIDFLVRQVGRPYNQAGIIDLALSRAATANGHWFCSQLQCAALETVRVLPSLGVPPARITPDTLAVACRAIGACRPRDVRRPSLRPAFFGAT